LPDFFSTLNPQPSTLNSQLPMLRLLRTALVITVLAPLIALVWIWLTLPSVDALYARERSATTRIVDSTGKLLYEIIDPRSSSGGHHTPVALDQISPWLPKATVAVEDASFYSNAGVDVRGVVRALWINLRGGQTLSGGSTITQQLARMMLLDPEERQQRTLLRKTRETLLAFQLTQRYSKDELLNLYLNEAYFGNLAYGVDAAARAYFGKTARELSLAESAFLAGLPQSPAAYDPFNDMTAARSRQAVVLDLMRKTGAISEDDRLLAQRQPIQLAPAPVAIRAPHFVSYTRRWLEQQFGAERVMAGGMLVTTTLDLALNDASQTIVQAQLARLAGATSDAQDARAGNAAVVVLDPHSGAIRAMVGSPDYFDNKINGAVNATLALRQPGSAFKPVTYAQALASGRLTAATPLFDVRRSFPTREALPYVPVNYDRTFHGPLSARDALATSSNVAAVGVLHETGIKPVLTLAGELGIGTLTQVDRHGLALTLGGGEVRLLELSAAYGAFGNGGQRLAPFAVSEVRDADGAVLYQRPAAQPVQALDPRVAWLITDILADNAARSAAFGANSVLRLPRPAAVKTGTTQDFRDNWTVGYTPDLVVGVWVGNADGSPMQGVSGVSGAGPIWRDVMLLAHRGLPVREFERPLGLTRLEVCALSGQLPTADCTARRFEWFLAGSEPTQPDRWHQREGGRVVLALPLELRAWALAQGWPLQGVRVAPQDLAAQAPNGIGLMVTQPDDGAVIRIDPGLPLAVQRLPIEVRADNPAIQRIELLLGDGRVLAILPGGGGRVFWMLEKGELRLTARAALADGRVIESAPVRVTVVE
jgi:penicillin-binding protein 1C